MARTKNSLPTRQLSLFDLQEREPPAERPESTGELVEPDPFDFGDGAGAPAGNMNVAPRAPRTRGVRRRRRR